MAATRVSEGALRSLRFGGSRAEANGAYLAVDSLTWDARGPHDDLAQTARER